MFNRIILGVVLLAGMHKAAVEGLSSKQLVGCGAHSLMAEVNHYRLNQSTLVSNPQALKQGRHKFLLSRLGKPKALRALGKPPIQMIQPVRIEQLVPKLPEEPTRYKFSAAVEDESAAKLKFNWTMMPPVNSSISQRFGTGEARFVHGIVYKVKSDQVVHAPIAGEVIFSGVMKEFEHVVMIEKDLENVILVAGISNSNLKSGEKVFRGQKIGAVIKGGWVYVEFRNAGNPIDPQKILASGSVNEE
jgi:murein DD-endopeptidase MepM/ murein hydrolase activator NlpD